MRPHKHCKSLSPFGKALNKIRIERGMTLQYMSGVLNCSYSYLSAVENGQAPIRNDFVKNLCKLLSIPENGLIELNQLALFSKPFIKLDLRLVSESHRRLSFDFQENFCKLTEQDILEIKKILKRGKEEDDDLL